VRPEGDFNRLTSRFFDFLLGFGFGFSRPATMERVVLFPQPEGPSRQIISPSSMVKERSLWWF